MNSSIFHLHQILKTTFMINNKKNFFLRIMWLLFALSLSFGQLQQIKFSPNINLYVHDFIGATILLLTLLFFQFDSIRLLKKKISTTDKKIKYAVLALLLGSVVSLSLTALSGNTIFIPVLYSVRFCFYLLLILCFYYLNYQKNIFNTTGIKLLLISVGILILWFGLIQYVLFPDTRSLSTLGWDDHYYRLISTIFDPAFTGIILIMTFWAWQQLKVYVKKNKILTFFFPVVSLLILGGTALTYSRSSFLVLASGLSIMSFKKKYLASYLLLFLLFIFLLPNPGGEGSNLTRTTSIQARQKNIFYTFQQTSPKTLIIGDGPFVFQAPDFYEHQNVVIPNHAKIPDNIIVFLIKSFGLLGSIISLWLLYRLGKWFYQRNLYLMISFMSILIHSLFHPSFVHPFVFLFFGMTTTVFFNKNQQR